MKNNIRKNIGEKLIPLLSAVVLGACTTFTKYDAHSVLEGYFVEGDSKMREVVGEYLVYNWKQSGENPRRVLERFDAGEKNVLEMEESLRIMGYVLTNEKKRLSSLLE